MEWPFGILLALMTSPSPEPVSAPGHSHLTPNPARLITYRLRRIVSWPRAETRALHDFLGLVSCETAGPALDQCCTICAAWKMVSLQTTLLFFSPKGGAVFLRCRLQS